MVRNETWNNRQTSQLGVIVNIKFPSPVLTFELLLFVFTILLPLFRTLYFFQKQISTRYMLSAARNIT